MTGKCNCEIGYGGSTCGIKLCGGEKKLCSNHGKCNAINATCTCNAGFLGVNCAISSCSNHGDWNDVTQKCTCETVTSSLGKVRPIYWGKYCQERSCPGYDYSTLTFEMDSFSFCSHKGECNGTTSECSCSAGRTGKGCNTPVSIVNAKEIEKELYTHAEALAQDLLDTHSQKEIVLGKMFFL